jgi:hypothetical protein
MMRMDGFQELGITASAETPSPRTATRDLRNLVAAILAGTAITAGAICALLVIVVAVVTIYATVQLQHWSYF